MPQVERRAYREHLRARLIENGVPESLHEGLTEYLAARRPVGSFLTAVLENNLTQAVLRADPMNALSLYQIVLFLANYAPSTAWGTPRKVGDWLLSQAPVPELFE